MATTIPLSHITHTRTPVESTGCVKYLICGHFGPFQRTPEWPLCCNALWERPRLLKSYLLYPRPGGREQLLEALSLIPECEVIPATNQDLFILVTSTGTAEEDHRLEETITSLTGFGNMALVSGYCGGLSEDLYA